MYIRCILTIRQGSLLNIYSSRYSQTCIKLRDNCIQNFHLGRYTVGNLFLLPHQSGAVKRDFRMYIQRYTSPDENFECGYPHSNALLQSRLNFI